MIELKNKMPSYAKDIKLNIGKYICSSEIEGLTHKQSCLIALSCAFILNNKFSIEQILNASRDILTESDIIGAKQASSIMAMNNIYYRFVHLADDSEYSKMKANLRMNVIANPAIEQVDFELCSLAVSIIAGCGLCINSHEKVLLKNGISKDSIASSAKIASVLNSAVQVLAIENV